jgi:DNA-binding MarR family transcriptional regulator
MENTPLPSAVLDTLHDLTLAYRRQMRAILEALPLPLPLTHNELKLLLYVGRHPLCTHKDLVAYTGADKAQVARMLQQMETAQWLERVPHPQDKRSRCLRLSTQGDAAYTALRKHRNALGEQMLQSMPTVHQHDTLAGLRQMHAQLLALPLPRRADGSTPDICAHPSHLHN